MSLKRRAEKYRPTRIGVTEPTERGFLCHVAGSCDFPVPLPERKWRQSFLLMKKTSATTTGLSAIELATAINNQQWSDLERFASRRLRRAASTPSRQRALAQFTGCSLINTALEKFGLGDCGHPDGRYLSQKQRVNAHTFLDALRGAINSFIADACRTSESAHDWLPIGNEREPGHHEPRDHSDVNESLTVRDLERQLFNELAAQAGDDPEQLAAIASLRDDCVTGHRRGDGDQNPEVKRQVRRQAREVWEQLSMD
jgi:hypothetical protein